MQSLLVAAQFMCEPWPVLRHVLHRRRLPADVHNDGRVVVLRERLYEKVF